MKKIMFLAFMAILSLGLSSCSSSDDDDNSVNYSASQFVGTWKVTSISSADSESTMGMVLKLKSGGTGTVAFKNADYYEENCTWKLIKEDGDNMLVISTDDGSSYFVIVSVSSTTLEVQNQRRTAHLTFTKQ